MFKDKSSFIKTFFLFLLFISQLPAQYSKSDYEIVKTTYQRSFDKNIIHSYLYSEDADKIKAALLSISHSEDTSFIPMLTSLPFKDYSEMICFAIGQIGPSYSSKQYLWEKAVEENFPVFSNFVFEAIGKVGDEADLNRIVDFYPKFDAPIFPYDGISLAIMQFSFRGIKTETAKQILIDEINNQLNSIQRKNQALFALARIGSSSEINNELKKILLLPSSENADTLQLKQFALMNFRTQKYFPSDENVFNNILQESNILLQFEIAKAICYKDYKTFAELDLYLYLINSENPNVSRASANSLQHLNIENEKLKDYVKEFIYKKLLANTPQNTRGELFSSMVKLYHPKPDSFPPEFFDKENIPKNYLYNYYGTMTNDSEILSELIEQYNFENNMGNKISLLENLLKFQKTFSENEALNKTIIGSLISEYPPLVSIAADGIDSVLINKEKVSILKKVELIIDREKDSSDFMEGVMSVANLAMRIDSSLFIQVVEELNKSKLYSIRKFIAEKTGKKLVHLKSLENFDDIWENAFTYKTAEVETEKGIFTIKFLPEVAPISVGNFCKLADNDFFDGTEYHRVVPGFVIQGGDPTETGWGGPGYDIISEFSILPYQIGMVGMASAGKDTEGSQWFVMQGNYPHLNGRYSIFAMVIQGMDAVYKIDQNDKILNVQLSH